MKHIKVIIFTISLFTVFNAKAQVYVDVNASGLNNGTSWQDAYRSLDTALRNTNSGEIWVAKGIYTPSTPIDVDNDDRKIAFYFKSMVACFGGFAGNETSKNQRNIIENPTVLSGEIGEKDVIEDNLYHIIYNDYDELDTNSVYDGFIITGAYYGNGWEDGSGGGIYLDNAGTPIIRNCIIMENYSQHGGGIFIERCAPIIKNNLIVNNQAFEGAGILLGWSADAIVQENKILFNESKNYPYHGYSSLTGGGIKIEAYSSPLIIENLIADNYSGHEGGGIYLSSNYKVNVYNNYIISNNSGDGGGVFVDGTSTNFINNLIVKNEANESGGGIFMDYTGNTRLINNTISLNTSSNGGGLYMTATNTEIINNILYYNKALKNNITFHNDASNSNQAYIYIGRADWRPEFTFNNIEGGLDNIGIRSDSYSNYSDSIFYEDNAESKPLFLDTLNNNFQVDLNSTVIDGGIQDTTGLNLPLYDFFKNIRFFNDYIDIGAIEYNGFYNTIENLYDLDSINSIIAEIQSFINSDVTFISEINFKEFEVYPNPFTDYIIISTNDKVLVNLYSIEGTLIFSNQIDSKRKINLSTLKNGVYLLRIDNGISKKIIKPD